MIHFLVDASLPRNTEAIIQSHGYMATDVRAIGMGSAPDAVIANHAKTNGMALMTSDHDFGDITVYPPQEYFGIVIIEQPARGNRQVIYSIIDQFLKAVDILTAMPGRLVIVDSGRIRMRPPQP